MFTVVYDFGKITDWLTAIGTIGAVVVSLYFSYNNVRPKRKIIKKVKTSLSGNVYDFKLINKGFIPIKIQLKGYLVYNFFWKRKKKKMIQGNYEQDSLELSDTIEMRTNSEKLSRDLINLGYKSGDKLILMSVFIDSAEKYHTKKFKFKVVNPHEIEEKREEMIDKLSKSL
ncbi:hypothetical protein [Oceanobacillus oncorhynchi]|uniref:hypothetical protein n=1 Tax=Oceanobacillus oncorhynchi TaxID=545501 RepID=UPI001866E68C|nr:hypothetical protein [Oceanobacillus oncorhynchi]